MTGRTQAAVSEAVAKIEAGVPAARTIAMAADLSHAAGCAHLIERVPRADILVNNVGIYEPKPFFEIADEDWQRMFEVNVMSGVRLTRHYLQAMLAEKDWGRVVFVSSESAVFVLRRWCTTASPSRRDS